MNDGAEEEDNEGEEDTNEDLYDPEAETRFEQLLNKIDGKNDNGESDHEDEKPPGEESQAEFVVTALTPDEKPADKVQTPVKNNNEPEADVEKVGPESESTIEKPQTTEDLSLAATVNDTSPTEGIVAPEPAKVSEPADVSENNSQASVTSLDESKESEELEPSPTTAPRRKAARGRKRPATGTRKKTTPRSTRSKKPVEDIVGSEDGVGNDVETDGLTESQEEIKKVKVDDEMSQESIGADESNENVQEEVAIEEDAKPKRVTRARAQRRKK